MALRVLVVMLMLLSPMGRLTSAVSQSARTAIETKAIACCPLCDASGSMGCGCGCGVSEVPMPATPDHDLAVLGSTDRWEPIEHEITDLVALVDFDHAPIFGAAPVEANNGLDRGGGIQTFLATTGHWII